MNLRQEESNRPCPDCLGARKKNKRGALKKTATVAIAMFALAACKNAGTGGGATAPEASADNRRVETVYDIAYIQMDSLVANYNRYIDLSSAFETKATKVTGDLEARARTLQNEVASLNEKVNKGLITTRDAQAEQNRIQTKGEQFDLDRQSRLNELAEEEQVMTNQIMHAINSYVAKFNADYRYKMILTTSGGAPVMHADPALNITSQIIKGLNEEYAAEKPAK